METKKLSDDQVKKLQEPLPADAIKPHPTKTYLSSIKAIYVVERLNKVFGIGSWHLKSEIVSDKTAMIVVKSTLTIPEYGIELESYGGNDNGGENSKNFDLGDAYKGATTDALTKICSFLEIGIDVFKGKSSPKPMSSTPTTTSPGVPETPESDKPWLNDNMPEFKSAVEKMRLGKSNIESLRKFFKISKAMEAKLKEQSSLQTA